MADETIKALAVQIALDDGSFQSGVKSLQRTMTAVDSNFKASVAGVKNWGSSLDALKANSQALSDKIGIQSNIISKYTEQLGKSKDALDQNSQKMLNNKTKLDEVKKAYEDSATSLGKSADKTKELKAELDKAQKAYDSSEKAVLSNNKAVENYTIQLNNAKGKLNEMDSELTENNTKIKENSSNWGKVSDSVKGASSKIGSGLVTGVKAAGTAIVGMGAATIAAGAGIYKLAGSASNLNEAQNVVQQTFKTSSKSVLEWTNGISNSAGIGKTAATSMVGSMGAMLKSSGLTESSASGMSEKMVQLSGDMASFYNLDNDTAWEKIRSGISGETEPLKQLGINMSVANLSAYALSQGMTKSYSSMTQGEKTQLRYNYLLSITKDAQGDFTRTSDGMANQQRLMQMNFENLTQSLGAMFLPMVNDGIKSVNGIATALNDAVTNGKGFDKLGDAVGSALSDLIGKISSTIPGMATAATSVLSQLISSLVKAIPAILPALTNGVVQLITAITTILQTNGPMLVTAGIQAIMTLISGLTSALPQIVQAAITTILTLVNSLTAQLPTLIPMAVQAILTIVNALLANLPQIISSAIKIVLALIQGIMNALPQLLAEVPKIILTIITGLTAALPQLIAMAPKIIVSVITGIIKALPQLIAMAPQIIAAVIVGLVQALPELLTMGPQMLSELWDGLKSQDWGQIGTDIIKGIVDGFSGAWRWVQQAVENVGKQIVKNFKSFFGIHSPSTLMRDEIGTNLGLGITEGLQNTDFMGNLVNSISANKSNLQNAIGSLSGSVNVGVKTTAQPSGTSSTASTIAAAVKSGNVIINNSFTGETPSAAEHARKEKNMLRGLALQF